MSQAKRGSVNQDRDESESKRCRIRPASHEYPVAAAASVDETAAEAGDVAPSQHLPPAAEAMSLQCAECKGSIVDRRTAGEKLSFCKDGTSLHLVMGATNEDREGIGFKVAGVPVDKLPNEKNPYRSVAYVRCANTRPDKGGRECNKKVGGVKCYPPLSDNRLIFFQHKALLVDDQPARSWKMVRDSSLRDLRLLPAAKEDQARRFKPRQWPPLVKSVAAPPPPSTAGPSMTAASPLMLGAPQMTKGTLPNAAQLTRTAPRGYQEELFAAVMGCERNSLVYLPTGLGKRLLASMVLRRMLDLNPGRQAFFLVETTALAMQQATQLQNEVRGVVEMLVGSSLQGYGDGAGGVDHGMAKLQRVREADIVVATAGAFEHCMCKEYVDPDSICCVVLDEAHHCGKDHPFNRVARSFLTIRAFSSVATVARRRASELPKLVALTASPAGERTLYDTVVKVEQLLDRLEAELAAPVLNLQEVMRLTPRVELELVNVTATIPEIALLGCLEKLVLSRVARLAPVASEVRVQAKRLLGGMGDRVGDAASAATAALGADVPRVDDMWNFPNKFFTALCQRALAASGGGGGANRGWAGVGDWEADEEAPPGFSSNGGGDHSNIQGRDHPSMLYRLMNVAFAVDEIGGRATWESTLEVLERGKTGGDPELDEALRVVKEHLLQDDARKAISNSHGGAGKEEGEAAAAAATSGGGWLAGSKLARITLLLEEHKRECDRSGKRFSALVFVSRRDLAHAVAAMLEAALPSVVQAQAVVGLSGMTLNQQRLALESFRDGTKNILVSTSVCGEGIDVPPCALVVCASLPASGTDLVQLRGRIRSKEKGCRFVGLTRTSGAADQAHLKSICLREKNMLEAIGHLSAGRGSESLAAAGMASGEAPGLAAAKAVTVAGTRGRAGFSNSISSGSGGSIGGGSGSSIGGGGDRSSIKAEDKAVPNGASPRRKVTPGSAGSGKDILVNIFSGGGGGGSRGGGGSGSGSISASPTSDEGKDFSETSSIAAPSTFSGGFGSAPDGGDAERESRPRLPPTLPPCDGSPPVKDPPAAGTGSAAATSPSVSPTRAPAGVEAHPSADASVDVDIDHTVGAVAREETGDGQAGAESGDSGGGGSGGCSGSGSDTGFTVAAAATGDEDRKGWNKILPTILSPAARRYAAMYLATCVRQALTKNPNQMARSTLNSAAQLAHTIKPAFDYHERKVAGPSNAVPFVFEARCVVSSHLEELSGLILVKRATGTTIKAARENAAVKVRNYLLAKDVPKAQPPAATP